MVENEEIDSFGEDPSNQDKIRQYCEEVEQFLKTDRLDADY